MASTVGMTNNPVFKGVTGLTNTTFDAEGFVSGRLTTEAQLLQQWRDVQELKERADACDRAILIWEARVQIVKMNTNTKNGYFIARNVGGTIVSSFEDNVRAGIMRRGKPYTVTFPVQWDDELYVRNLNVHREANSCSGYYDANSQRELAGAVEYRYCLDGEMGERFCPAGGTRNGFWIGRGSLNNTIGQRVNYGGTWYSGFVQGIGNDGTVSITDSRRLGTFNIIRYYTQWVLKECVDGSIIADNPDW